MATEFSAFDAPTLPAPGGAQPTPPLPPPSETVPAPSAPQLPGLPDHTSAPQLPPLPANTAFPAPTPGASTDEATHTPSEPPASPKRGVPVGLLVALFAAAVVGIAAFLVLSGGSDGDADAVVAEPQTDDNDATSAESDPETAIGQMLDDANDVVADINANAEEEELLAELGLDATGNPIAVPAGDAGYRFTWSDPSGQDLDIVVDATTGNYSVVASDGIQFRMIDDVYFGQAADGDEWYELVDDPFGDIPVVGLDGIPSESIVLPDSVRPYIVSETLDGSTRVIMIDDVAYAAAEPDARRAWLAPWGLLDDAAYTPTRIVVHLTFDPSGENVVGVHIDTPAVGGFAAFSVTEAYETAPEIDNPLSALPVDEAAVDLGE